MEKEEVLDDTWINNFEAIDKLYSKFYKDDVYHIKIDYIYINNKNEINKIKEEFFFMQTPNIISKEEIIAIIKKNSLDDGARYSLLSLLKYNININPEEVGSFLNSKSDNNYNFITNIKNIDQIFFDRTINMYHELNNLFVIYYEKSENKNKSTLNNNNITKKIYFRRNSENKNHKKTIRN
jgi:hypothetical protein